MPPRTRNISMPLAWVFPGWVSAGHAWPEWGVVSRNAQRLGSPLRDLLPARRACVPRDLAVCVVSTEVSARHGLPLVGTLRRGTLRWFRHGSLLRCSGSRQTGMKHGRERSSAPPSSPPDRQSSHRQGGDAFSLAEARLAVRPLPLQLPCGVAARVDVMDVEMRSASIDGKLDLELHPVSRNRKVTDRTRDTDAGSSPRVIGRASRKLPLSDGIAGALAEDGFVHSTGHLSARPRTT